MIGFEDCVEHYCVKLTWNVSVKPNITIINMMGGGVIVI